MNCKTIYYRLHSQRVAVSDFWDKRTSQGKHEHYVRHHTNIETADNSVSIASHLQDKCQWGRFAYGNYHQSHQSLLYCSYCKTSASGVALLMVIITSCTNLYYTVATARLGSRKAGFRTVGLLLSVLHHGRCQQKLTF